MFGHVRRLSDNVPAHTALRLSIGRRVAGGLQWKRRRRLPRNTSMVSQLEFDIGTSEDNAWNAGAERDEWRALRPAVGYGVSE